MPICANRASTAAWLEVVGAFTIGRDMLEEFFTWEDGGLKELVAGEALLLLLVPVDPLEPDGM